MSNIVNGGLGLKMTGVLPGGLFVIVVKTCWLEATCEMSNWWVEKLISSKTIWQSNMSNIGNGGLGLEMTGKWRWLEAAYKINNFWWIETNQCESCLTFWSEELISWRSLITNMQGFLEATFQMKENL